jgi:hypothetical protein
VVTQGAVEDATGASSMDAYVTPARVHVGATLVFGCATPYPGCVLGPAGTRTIPSKTKVFLSGAAVQSLARCDSRGHEQTPSPSATLHSPQSRGHELHVSPAAASQCSSPQNAGHFAARRKVRSGQASGLG